MPEKFKNHKSQLITGAWQEFKAQHRYQRQLSQLASMSAWMLLGVLALMTFLLSVGLQHPKTNLSVFLYLALSVLGLNLIVFVIGSMLKGTAAKVSRVLQQILFIVAVISVISFAIAASRIFFDIPASPAAAPTTSDQAQ